jgi:hypothetical protein
VTRVETGNGSAKGDVLRIENLSGRVSVLGSQSDCSGGDTWIIRAQPTGGSETRVGSPGDADALDASGIHILHTEEGSAAVILVRTPAGDELALVETEVAC